MPGYYAYLMSSLPMLYFGAKPPFSFDRLLEMCEGVVSREDIESVKISTMIDGREGDRPPAARPPAVDKWRTFGRTLRNELVKTRAVRKKSDPARYMRGEPRTDPYLARIAAHAHRYTSILEAEEYLDRERWNFLDDLGVGNCFDIDSLIVYANKLLILERWKRIDALDKSGALENTLAQEGAA